MCLIIDAYSRIIVDWGAVSPMKTETVPDAIEMAAWCRGKHLPELHCHLDAGSQCASIVRGERLTDIVPVHTIGGVGGPFDNALAETGNGYWNTEIVRGPDPQGPGKPFKK